MFKLRCPCAQAQTASHFPMYEQGGPEMTTDSPQADRRRGLASTKLFKRKLAARMAATFLPLLGAAARDTDREAGSIQLNAPIIIFRQAVIQLATLRRGAQRCADGRSEMTSVGLIPARCQRTGSS